MSLRTVALDLMAVGVLLSLLTIVLFVVFGAVISLLTLARARSQHGRHTGQLPGLFGSEDLAEIDVALERIMSEESGALPLSGRTALRSVG
jgi:hypothetical protein